MLTVLTLNVTQIETITGRRPEAMHNVTTFPINFHL